MGELGGKVALVAGATRGAGRGIARALGEQGATVYCTGRSSRARARGPRESAPEGGPGPSFILANRSETIEETAELVDAAGGRGVAVAVDHTDEAAVKALVDRIRNEAGRLDVLVNDIWGGEELTEWGKPFWEQDVSKGFLMLQRAVHTHIITNRHAAPLLIQGKGGLIVEITDGDTARYRGSLFYDLVKSSVIRLAFGMGDELRPHGVTAVALTPGFLRSEAMLEFFGVTEANWKDGAAKDPHFIASETPLFVGRAVAALAADPKATAKSGGVYSSWGLAKEYGFTDADGSRPDWGAYFAKLGL
jgi:NAD(P)-dependent dehydrogenase (short-subunit alcohol dehydrogenase family)